jgi:hypothetical protein
VLERKSPRLMMEDLGALGTWEASSAKIFINVELICLDTVKIS